MTRLQEIKNRAQSAYQYHYGNDGIGNPWDFSVHSVEDMLWLLEVVEKLSKMEHLSRTSFWPAEPKSLNDYDEFKNLEASLPDEIRALLNVYQS